MSSRLRGSHVGRLLVAAERRFNRDLIAALRARGFRDIRPAHGAVFANLEEAGTRPSELARRAEMTKQAMGELIADLGSKGYLEKQPDPEDGRANLVVLTERGRRVDAAADAAIAAIEAEYAARLGRPRFEELLQLIAELGAGTRPG